MRLLCDQMLIRLGKWLRAAGYDTVIIEDSIPDDEIFSLALQEDRLLITRDRHFLEMKDANDRVVWLESNEVDECAKELSKKLTINWLLKPFSRCITCNTIFEEAVVEDLKEVPEDILEKCSEYSKCPHCKKVFWLGSHTARMHQQLELWASLAGP